MSAPERPICRGQVWEVHSSLHTQTATVLGPPLLSRGQVYVPVAYEHFAPSMVQPDALIELRAVPGGPTLTEARRIRGVRDTEPPEPARLHELAEREVAQSHDPGLSGGDTKRLVEALYQHAIYEAGWIIHKGQNVGPSGMDHAYDPCPVCGYRADGGIPVAGEPNPARWLSEDELTEDEIAEELGLTARAATNEDGAGWQKATAPPRDEDRLEGLPPAPGTASP